MELSPSGSEEIPRILQNANVLTIYIKAYH